MTINRDNSEISTKSDGPVAAALFAMGIGVVAYGVFVILAEVSASFNTFETLNASVGSLSGKTTFGVLVWLVAWLILHITLGKKSFELKRAFMWSMVLVAIGVLFTFPIFFQAFAKG
jgi:uncharacterized MAPEG superfamily protein